MLWEFKLKEIIIARLVNTGKSMFKYTQYVLIFHLLFTERKTFIFFNDLYNYIIVVLG